LSDKTKLDDFALESPAGFGERKQVKWTPWILSCKMLCLGFVPRDFSKLPRQTQLLINGLHRVGLTKWMMHYIEEGWKFGGYEKNSGQFGGRIDITLLDENGRQLKLDAKSSRYVKPQQIIQDALYHEGQDRIAVCSINEVVELPDDFIKAVHSTAHETTLFLEDFPEKASEVFTPHEDVCPLCDNRNCPYKVGRG
jgi:hypothetical protein